MALAVALVALALIAWALGAPSVNPRVHRRRAPSAWALYWNERALLVALGALHLALAVAVA